MSDDKRAKQREYARRYREKNKIIILSKQKETRKEIRGKATVTSMACPKMSVKRPIATDDINVAIDLFEYAKTKEWKFIHVVAYGEELFDFLCLHYKLLAYCYCGPRIGGPTHIHGLFLVDTTHKFEVNFVNKERYHCMRSRDVNCIKHYINCLHYMSCTRASISNKFKTEPHFHSELNSPFPPHPRAYCNDLCKKYLKDKHSHLCKCHKFFQKKNVCKKP